MATVLVTGASRGIGLELVRQLVTLSTSQASTIFALSRSEPAGPFGQLLAEHAERVIHVRASVTSLSELENAVRHVKQKLDGRGLDILVNNAGVASYSPDGIQTCTSEQLMTTFEANVIGVQCVTTAFLPLLEAGTLKRVINVSSTLSSITLASKFKPVPSHAYKVSKAALNMLNAQWAVAYAEAGFTFLLVSPGWLQTDLGGKDADLPVETGVSELKRIILQADSSQNGKFLNIHVPGQEESWGQYDGKEVAW